MKKFAIVLSLLILVCASAVSAEGVEYGTDHAFNTKYVWRGIAVNPEMVWQPDVWASYAGFTASVWGNFDLTDAIGTSGEFSELDYTLDYSGGFSGVSYSLGFIYYHFPNASAFDTSEIYLGIGLDVPLSPSVTIYKDIDLVEGMYIVLSISHDWEIKNFYGSTLSFGASAAYSSANHSLFYYGANDEVLADAMISLALEVPLSDRISITPAVNVNFWLDSDLNDLGINEEDMTFWGGITLSATFGG